MLPFGQLYYNGTPIPALIPRANLGTSRWQWQGGRLDPRHSARRQSSVPEPTLGSKEKRNKLALCEITEPSVLISYSHNEPTHCEAPAHLSRVNCCCQIQCMANVT